METATALFTSFKQVYYGGIYTADYEEFSDGGPKCYESMTNTFRISIAVFSSIVNIFIIRWCMKYIRKSKELDLSLVKSVSPSAFEYFVGIICYAAYFIQAYMKFATGKGIFMNNPCHFVVLFSAILLTTNKTKTTAMIYISLMRWLFGPYLALVFPVLSGLNLPFEPEMFFIEHYLAAFIGPLTLMLCGRYGFYNESAVTLIAHQFFGFSGHILYMRFLMMPQSVLTWTNLNYTLCYPETDLFVPYIGNYYYYLADHYLNLLAFLIILVHLAIYAVLVSPVFTYKKLFVKAKEIKAE